NDGDGQQRHQPADDLTGEVDDGVLCDSPLSVLCRRFRGCLNRHANPFKIDGTYPGVPEKSVNAPPWSSAAGNGDSFSNARSRTVVYGGAACRGATRPEKSVRRADTQSRDERTGDFIDRVMGTSAPKSRRVVSAVESGERRALFLPCSL